MGDSTPTRLLRVNLDARTVENEPVPERWLREFVGGKGLAVRYLYGELDAGIDPLGPENVLLFMLGPLSGHLPGDPRYAAVTKSPLTGVFLDSYGGGEFPTALASVLEGYVGVLVEGIASEPVVLELEDGGGSVRPVPELWGSDVEEVAAAFPDATVASIGPAGENLVRYATIATDGGEHHAGRGGAGAVMGSKRVKAVVAKGTDRVANRSDAAFADLREEYVSRLVTTGEGRWHAASGTLETADFADELGVLPTRGWQETSFDGTEGIGIDAVRDAAVERERVDEDVPGDFRVSVGEGETVPRGGTPIALGSGLGIGDFEAVATLGGLCDRLGLDVISAGNAVAWAVLASERGLVDRKLSFGEEHTARDVLEEIASRSTELGDLLADGVDTAAERLGGEGLVPTVKAMEVPSYDPRRAPAMALAYATSDRGACHRRARPVTREAFEGAWTADRAARIVSEEQDRRSVLWSLIVDDVTAPAFTDLGAPWLRAIGFDVDQDALTTTGERIWTLTRLFNVREGITRDDDSLPDAFTREPVDPSNGSHPEPAIDPGAFDRALSAYYEVRGWDEEGRPTQSLLERLGLDDVIDETTPVGP